MYVDGLPATMSEDGFNELMSKCGMIMFDPHTKKPKTKLYKDEHGNNKGDGRCCYIKVLNFSYNFKPIKYSRRIRPYQGVCGETIRNFNYSVRK